jgi:hypothetical protein
LKISNKNDWQGDSHSRDPEFKPQYHQKKDVLRRKEKSNILGCTSKLATNGKIVQMKKIMKHTIS